MIPNHTKLVWCLVSQFVAVTWFSRHPRISALYLGWHTKKQMFKILLVLSREWGNDPKSLVIIIPFPHCHPFLAKHQLSKFSQETGETTFNEEEYMTMVEFMQPGNEDRVMHGDAPNQASDSPRCFRQPSQTRAALVWFVAVNDSLFIYIYIYMIYINIYNIYNI